MFSVSYLGTLGKRLWSLPSCRESRSSSRKIFTRSLQAGRKKLIESSESAFVL